MSINEVSLKKVIMKRCNFLYLLLLVISTLSNTLPPSPIGKTHFIMGEPTLPLPTVAQRLLPRSVSHPAPVEILFSPADNIRRRLLQLINNEREAIYGAIYMITDLEVANALCAARKRGIRVELITDVGCLKDRASKITQLSKCGCLIYIYNPMTSSKGVSLMHHKFALFSYTSSTWTGSYNFTKAANNTNRENVVIFSDKLVFTKYFDEFKGLKNQSYEYTRERISSV